LIPPDLDAAYRAVLAAVQHGEISEARLDESVQKILRVKASLGLNRARLVDLSALDSKVGTPANMAVGQQMADDAITLVKQQGAVLPLKKAGTISGGLPYQAMAQVRNELLVVIISDDVRLDTGRVLERQIKMRAPEANVTYTDPQLAEFMGPQIVHAARDASRIVVAVFASPTAGKMVKTGSGVKNSLSLAEPSASLL